MPIVDLLGVQFDMQLVWRLSLSVAAVLLVSWAYKFYNARDKRIRRSRGKNGSCQKCDAMLDLKNESEDMDNTLKESDNHLMDNSEEPVRDTVKDVDAFDPEHWIRQLCSYKTETCENSNATLGLTKTEPKHVDSQLKENDNCLPDKSKEPARDGVKDEDAFDPEHWIRQLYSYKTETCENSNAMLYLTKNEPDDVDSQLKESDDSVTDQSKEEPVGDTDAFDPEHWIRQLYSYKTETCKNSNEMLDLIKTQPEDVDSKYKKSDSCLTEKNKEEPVRETIKDEDAFDPNHWIRQLYSNKNETSENSNVMLDLTKTEPEDVDSLLKESDKCLMDKSKADSVTDSIKSEDAFNPAQRMNQLCNNKNEACQKSNVMLDLSNNKTEDEGNNSKANDNCLTGKSTEELTRNTVKREDAFNPAHSDNTVKEDTLSLHRQLAVSTSNISFGASLKHTHPAESGMASATGRLSPCFLQRLEGSVGVGRELRQDLERQGAHCSFLSKAEIKVEDANVLAEGTGDQIVRGKIYDYYVESSSRSITESGEAKPVVEVACHGNGESLGSTNTIIMRDLVLTQSYDQNPYTRLGKLTQGPPARPALQRYESYQCAAEESELAILPLTSTTTKTSSVSAHSKICPSVDRANMEESELDVKPLFLQLQLSDCTDLESVKSKINLGNCLEILQLAKRGEHTLLQQAALCVMSDNYLQVLRDPNLYGRLLAGEREQIRKLRMKGRSYVMVADIDPRAWVQDTEETKPSSAIYYYDDFKDTWQKLCQIPPEVLSKSCAMCTLDNYLYVALGCQCTGREVTPSKRVFCYNPLTSIWKEISPMNQPRPRCKLAALDGCVYAIGGECLSSVERYDPRVDRWAFVAPLPNDTFAVAHHVAVCDGEIFVSGGTLRCMLLRYNSQANSWRASLLGSKDRTADMVAVGRFLYRFDVNPLLGLSVYRYHTVARLWYECSSRRILRCPAFQCVAMYGNVYCVNRQFTIRFDADEVFPGFADEELSVLPAARGMLFPFVLSLPDKKPRQTSV